MLRRRRFTTRGKPVGVCCAHRGSQCDGRGNGTARCIRLTLSQLIDRHDGSFAEELGARRCTGEGIGESVVHAIVDEKQVRTGVRAEVATRAMHQVALEEQCRAGRAFRSHDPTPLHELHHRFARRYAVFLFPQRFFKVVFGSRTDTSHVRPVGAWNNH